VAHSVLHQQQPSSGLATAQVISFDGEQAVKLPAEFRVSSDSLSIRKDGDAIILEPLKPLDWPEGFFQEIHIDDPAFVRPPQGQMPPVSPLD
jgi:virulence-associated protein VagC